MNLPQNLRESFSLSQAAAIVFSSSLDFSVHPIDSWSKQDVQKWIEYCIDEYSLGDVHLNDFEMNGALLVDSFVKNKLLMLISFFALE